MDVGERFTYEVRVVEMVGEFTAECEEYTGIIVYQRRVMELVWRQ